ncbi:MAG: hypothetical protein JXB34_04260 [Bacteroidales bacterium]|nr:hypothetical protein [Bacteroidales bacterium]
MDLWQFTPVAIIYFITSGISFLLAFLSWQMRPVKGAGLFSFMMLSVTLWVLASLLGLFSNSFDWKILMLKFEYIGMAGAVYLWLTFVAVYTHYDRWLKKWMYALLAIIPLITLYHVFQAPEGTTIHESYYLVTKKGISYFAPNFSGMFYIWTAYAYLLMLLGVIFLLLRIFQTPPGLRKQLVLLIPAVFVVMLPNILYITGKNPFEPYDPTPLALVIVGILFLSTMYFFQFLNVVPIAHDLVIKSVKAGVIILNRKNLILEINPVAIQFLGLPATNYTGKNIAEIMPQFSELPACTGQEEETKSDIVLGACKKNYELKVTSLKDSTQTIQGKIIMLWDITEQKMAMNELDAYARTVAHDLKNPLGQMMGYAQLLKEDIDSEKLRNEYLDHIITGGEKMKTIIDGLLTLAKIRNLQKIDMMEVDMQYILQTVMIRLHDSIKRRDAVINLPQTWKKAYGNSIWVEEVWINLITNALKYGGTPPVIELGSEIVGDFVRFWVKDNGEGMSQNDLGQIFEEFSRIHPNKDSIKGHGLGLSIVQRIIKKMGGDVNMTSKIGHGSVFFFTLPAVENNY